MGISGISIINKYKNMYTYIYREKEVRVADIQICSLFKYTLNRLLKIFFAFSVCMLYCNLKVYLNKKLYEHMIWGKERWGDARLKQVD